MAPPDAAASPSSSAGFRKVTLDDAPGEPIGLAVLPSGQVLHTSRTGTLWLHDLDGKKTVAAELPVYSHDEEGLQGVAVDPDFEQNRWVYLYYSPPLDTPLDDPDTTAVDESVAPLAGSADTRLPYRGAMRLSRFVLARDQLDLASEQVILEIPTDRGICCHVGGQIDFDAAGDLYLSTGDDTNPFQSEGYSPIDERSDRHPAFDAQRTSANTNDLRGKLLRIRVAEDGSYSLPEGNLFAPGTPLARPEIYAMGLRNPFRFAVDQTTGVIYLADYAPDAGADDPRRGPRGTGKWIAISAPGNYGWPYCAAPGRPYVDFDFATRVSSEPFDCDRPVNDSPNNTGLRELPPVRGAALYYSYGPAAGLPELGTGGVGPMAGPPYRHDPERSSGSEWPLEYAGAPLFYEWTRDFIAVFHLDDSLAISSIERISTDVAVSNPIDAEFGPDGALYVLEYGDGYYMANPDARLSRIEFAGRAR